MKATLLVSGATPDPPLGIVQGKIHEAINKITSVELLLSCETVLTPEDLEELIEQPATLTLEADSESGPQKNRWDGLIFELTEARKDQLGGDSFHFYNLLMRPALWRLGFNTRTRNFQDSSRIQAVSTVLEDNGFVDGQSFKKMLLKEGAYPPREQVTQFRTSDLRFVQRELAAAGINFLFGVDDDCAVEETLQLVDDNAFIKKRIPDPVRVVPETGMTAEGPHVSSVNVSTRLAPASVAVSLDSGTGANPNDRSTHSIGDDQQKHVGVFGGPIASQDEAVHTAKVLAQALDSQKKIWTGSSNVHLMRAGEKAALEVSSGQSPTLELLLIDVRHRFEQTAVAATGGKSDLKYANTFSAVGADVQIRPMASRVGHGPRAR